MESPNHSSEHASYEKVKDGRFVVTVELTLVVQAGSRVSSEFCRSQRQCMRINLHLKMGRY